MTSYTGFMIIGLGSLYCFPASATVSYIIFGHNMNRILYLIAITRAADYFCFKFIIT